MAKRVTPIKEMEKRFKEILQDYEDLTADETAEIIDKTAKKVRKNIRKNAPKDTETYSKSWATKTMRETRYKISSVVYSKNRWQIAHLLEYGHDLVSHDGRKIRYVDEREHVKPAIDDGEKELMKQLQRIYLKRGKK